MLTKPILTPQNPGPWGSHGALVKARHDTEVVIQKAKDLEAQLKSGTLDPDSVKAHVAKIEECLKILKEHANNPSKFG